MKISSEVKTYTEYTTILNQDEVNALLKMLKFLKEDMCESAQISKTEYIMLCDLHNKLVLAK